MDAIIAAAVAAIGMLISAGKDAEAQGIRQRIADEFGPQILPELDAAVAQEAGPAANRTEDDAMRREQLATLAELDDVYQTAGQTDADEAAYTVAGRKVAQRAGQQAGDIGIEAARRGQTGSGLGATLGAASGQSELEALAGMDAEIASSGRDRGLRALGMKSSLASGVRGDDWKALSGQGDATDMMNRFNATQRQQMTLRNAGLAQQQFDNMMRQRSAKGAALTGVAGGLSQQGADARQTAGGVANSVLSYGSAWDEPDVDDEENDH